MRMGDTHVYRSFLFGCSAPVGAFVQYCNHAGKSVEIALRAAPATGAERAARAGNHCDDPDWAKTGLP